MAHSCLCDSEREKTRLQGVCASRGAARGAELTHLSVWTADLHVCKSVKIRMQADIPRYIYIIIYIDIYIITYTVFNIYIERESRE